MNRLHLYILGAAAAILTACTRSDGWTLEGIAPDETDTVYILAPTMNGGWYKVDSAAVDNGRYSFSLPRAKNEIYRVDLGNKTYYVPADSTETITLDADGTRSGSAEAEMFNAVDAAVAFGADSKDILRALDGNYASTAAYYATRAVRNRLLLRTVANRFNEEHPGDPRTEVLLDEVERMLAKGGAPSGQQIIVADEISYYDIELMDRDGRMHKLSETADTNPLVILAYVDFTADNVQAITRALGDAQSAGAAIYEIGFHENQHLWANATEGLPWTAVYQSDAGDKMHISRYAVTAFPTFFILKNGEITERVSDYTKILDAINRHK